MFQKMKLGKKAPVFDKRTLRFKSYTRRLAGLPPVNQEVSWVTKFNANHAFPMYLNDTLGTCVEAAAGHMIQQWSHYSGQYFEPMEQSILQAYEIVGGYVPGEPGTDNGTDMLSFLKFWRNTGIEGHQIAAFMMLDPTNAEEVRTAIYLFGNIFCGFAMPLSSQSGNFIVPRGGIYSAAGRPGGWGGHCMPIMAASPITRTGSTWGTTPKMSHNFFTDYCDEAYVVLSRDWINASQLAAPSGFDFDQLNADLALL